MRALQEMLTTHKKSKEVRLAWDEWYSDHDRSSLKHNNDFWLSRYILTIETRTQLPVLDLGCGGGFDARHLLQLNMRVIASDFSQEALRITREVAPNAEIILFDMSDGLPFPDASFNIIVANLSLHYFSWRKTQEIIDTIYNKLRVRGYLLARLNSKNDKSIINISHQDELRIEPNYYMVQGFPKRFFDSASIEALFQKRWKLHNINEMSINPYYTPKLAWEIAVEKT